MDIILLIVGIVAWVIVGRARKEENKSKEKIAAIVRNISFLLVILIWVFYVMAKHQGLTPTH
jgi:hypothetical protein